LHTRECLGDLVDRSITAKVLIDQLDASPAAANLDAAIRSAAYPAMTDQGVANRIHLV
jgi:hypothetical protein